MDANFDDGCDEDDETIFEAEQKSINPAKVSIFLFGNHQHPNVQTISGSFCSSFTNLCLINKS